MEFRFLLHADVSFMNFHATSCPRSLRPLRQVSSVHLCCVCDRWRAQSQNGCDCAALGHLTRNRHSGPGSYVASPKEVPPWQMTPRSRSVPRAERPATRKTSTAGSAVVSSMVRKYTLAARGHGVAIRTVSMQIARCGHVLGSSANATSRALSDAAISTTGPSTCTRWP